MKDSLKIVSAGPLYRRRPFPASPCPVPGSTLAAQPQPLYNTPAIPLPPSSSPYPISLLGTRSARVFGGPAQEAHTQSGYLLVPEVPPVLPQWALRWLVLPQAKIAQVQQTSAELAELMQRDLKGLSAQEVAHHHSVAKGLEEELQGELNQLVDTRGAIDYGAADGDTKKALRAQLEYTQVRPLLQGCPIGVRNGGSGGGGGVCCPYEGVTWFSIAPAFV